jgi:hypothetical protein
MSGNFVRKSTGSGKACARLYPGFPQKRVDAALKQGQDCGHDRTGRRLSRGGDAFGARAGGPAGSGTRRLGTGRHYIRGLRRQATGAREWAPICLAGHERQLRGCPVPTAFLVEGRKVRPFGAGTHAGAPESGALGWLRDGSAVVHFPVGACGRSLRTPGDVRDTAVRKAAAGARHN